MNTLRGQFPRISFSVPKEFWLWRINLLWRTGLRLIENRNIPGLFPWGLAVQCYNETHVVLCFAHLPFYFMVYDFRNSFLSFPLYIMLMSFRMIWIIIQSFIFFSWHEKVCSDAYITQTPAVCYYLNIFGLNRALSATK